MLIPEINDVLNSFRTVGLEAMDTTRLMNRIDTKYVLSIRKLPELLIRMDGAYRVLEINNNRLFSYFTTYLDTNDFLFFNQHVTGKLERNKVRYRKYETTGITYLEVKRRTNKDRTIKWRIEHNLTPGSECDEKARDFIKEYVPQKPLLLKPVLINSFKRITLVGSEINERITIDQDLSYSDTTGNQVRFPSVAIIEHKRERFTSGSPVGEILKECFIHPTGFSKYCFGTAIMHDIPRKNMLKPKLLLINKIENEFNNSSPHPG